MNDTVWLLQDMDGNLKVFKFEKNVFSHIPNGTKARRVETAPRHWKITSGKKVFTLWNQRFEDTGGLIK